MANVPVITVLFSLSWVVGMVIFACYADCDPLTRGYISKFDEIVPFYVEDKFVYLPGLLGLVMATLFNSALSLAVSNLNSLATVTWEDFFSQIPALNNLKDTQQLNIIKFISILYGFVIMGVSFLVGMLSGVIESSMLMTSATSGPLLGVFILALLVPCANWKGASTGMICSHIITLWITFGSLTIDKPVVALPLSEEGCHNNSFSDHIMRPGVTLSLLPNDAGTNDAFTTPSMIRDPVTEPVNGLTYLYSITYMYYAFIGSLTTVLIGIVVSLLTADAEHDMYEEHLLHPIAVKFSRLLPGRKRLYASSTRLGSAEETSSEAVEEPTGKLGPNPSLDTNGKPELDSGYVKKLRALKGLSLDVTNEVSKSTKL